MRARIGVFWTGLAVVVVVELARLMSLAPVVRYALFPPLAVIAFLAFRDPDADLAGWRSVVLLPVLGALIGVFLVHLPEALGIAVGLFAILAAMEVLHATAPPALAIVLLAFLLNISVLVYPLSVLVSTLVVYGGVSLLRHLSARRQAPSKTADDRL